MMNNCDRLEFEHNFTIFTGMDGHLAIGGEGIEESHRQASNSDKSSARRACIPWHQVPGSAHWSVSKFSNPLIDLDLEMTGDGIRISNFFRNALGIA